MRSQLQKGYNLLKWEYTGSFNLFFQFFEKKILFRFPDGEFCAIFFFLFYLNFYFYFISLYNTVLVLPYIDMNLPRVYMSSQTWTPLPPPTPHHPIQNDTGTRNVHNSTIYNTQDMKSTQVSIKRWMDKEDVVYKHNGILFSH